MQWIKDEIAKIKVLVSAEKLPELRYAALDARLLIEKICYTRLELAHPYISFEKMRRNNWSVARVLDFIVKEVEPKILSSAIIHMDPDPWTGEMAPTLLDFEMMNWVEVGTQSPIDVKSMTKNFHKLGSFLHSKMPNNNIVSANSSPSESESDEAQKLTKAVNAALAACSLIAAGTINFHLPSETKTFVCICGTEITRTLHSFKNASIVSCLSNNCDHTYQLDWNDDVVNIKLRVAKIVCPHCHVSLKQPMESIAHLSFSSIYETDCKECSKKFRITPTFKVL